MQPLMKNGLSYKKALGLLGYSVDARGAVTPSAPAPAAPAPAAAPVGRPRLLPHQAAAALAARGSAASDVVAPPVRRRLRGKQRGSAASDEVAPPS